MDKFQQCIVADWYREALNELANIPRHDSAIDHRSQGLGTYWKACSGNEDFYM
jgi:hypothetical protein